ncbi:MAG TPA: hypothetical protein DDW51_22855 [Cyanobacteria bacterium UBA11367]|nr:hypothetical protein [Cyanobacteria bacterium UBA11367]HBE60789.1 hypothetical protein [Cyanobacteria bacterium UBA11366]HBS72194.1 hypothetical protein [Cyanobacteria bacterium UBA11153]
MLPAPFDLDKSKPPKKQEIVKITKLPATTNSSSQVSPQFSPKPTPESSPQPSKSVFPEVAVARRVFQTENTPDNETSQDLVKPNLRRNSKPKQKHKKSRDLPDESHKSPDSPDNSKKPQNLPDNSNKPSSPPSSGTGNNTPAPIVNFFAQFPRYPGAEKGSGGVLRSQFDEAAYIFHTTDILGNVSSYFERELQKSSNFKPPKPLTTGESNLKIYEISNSTGSETNYLHLIVKGGKTVIYLESKNYTMAQLIDAETEDRKDEMLVGYLFEAIAFVKKQYKLQNFNPDTDLDTLADKDKFQTSNFILKKAIKTTSNSPVSNNQLIDALNLYLKNYKLEPLSNEGNYGGGTLYTLKSGKYESYIVFAPTKDNQTVIIWSNDKPN